MAITNVEGTSGMAIDGANETLWGLLQAAVIGAATFAFGLAWRAFNLSNANKKDIDYIKRDMKKLMRLPDRMTRVEGNVKAILRSVKNIEAHTLRNQVSQLNENDQSQGDFTGDENDEDDSDDDGSDDDHAE